jgi:hypothetical protein
MANFIKPLFTNLINYWYKEADKILDITKERQQIQADKIELNIKRLEDNYHIVLFEIFTEESEMTEISIKNMIEKYKEPLLEPINNMVDYYYDIKMGTSIENPINRLRGDELERFYIYFIAEILCSDYSTEKYNSHSQEELTFVIQKCQNKPKNTDIQNLTEIEIDKRANKRIRPNSMNEIDITDYTLRKKFDETYQKEINDKNLKILHNMSKKFNENIKKINKLKQIRSNKSIITHKTHDMLVSEIKSTTGKRKRSGSGGKKKSRKTKKNKKM